MSWNEEKGSPYADKLEQTIEGIQKILELQGNRIVTAEDVFGSATSVARGCE